MLQCYYLVSIVLFKKMPKFKFVFMRSFTLFFPNIVSETDIQLSLHLKDNNLFRNCNFIWNMEMYFFVVAFPTTSATASRSVYVCTTFECICLVSIWRRKYWTKNNWLKVPSKTKDAKPKIVGGDFIWILTAISWSNLSLYNIYICAISFSVVLNSK